MDFEPGSAWDELRALPAWHREVAPPSALGRAQNPLNLGTTPADAQGCQRPSLVPRWTPTFPISHSPGLPPWPGAGTGTFPCHTGTSPCHTCALCFLLPAPAAAPSSSGHPCPRAQLPGPAFPRGKVTPTPLPRLPGTCREPWAPPHLVPALLSPARYWGPGLCPKRQLGTSLERKRRWRGGKFPMGRWMGTHLSPSVRPPASPGIAPCLCWALQDIPG